MSDTTYTITKDGGSYKVEIKRLAACRHVVPRRLGGIGWGGEQPSALLERQEVATLHEGLGWKVKRRS